MRIKGSLDLVRHFLDGDGATLLATIGIGGSVPVLLDLGREEFFADTGETKMLGFGIVVGRQGMALSEKLGGGLTEGSPGASCHQGFGTAVHFAPWGRERRHGRFFPQSQSSTNRVCGLRILCPFVLILCPVGTRRHQLSSSALARRWRAGAEMIEASLVIQHGES
jgi:hypothetical protein